MHRFSLVLLGGVMLSACGGGDGGTGPTPSTIVANAGNNQVGPAGAALAESLAVLVRDAAGDPLGGVSVTFAVTAGGGAVSPASRQTDASGIAKTRFTLGPTAGTQTVNATAGSLTPAPFSAISQINGAVNITNSTTGPLADTVGTVRADSLAVLVTDQNATPVPGITVNWASAAGTVSGASVQTSAAGLSKVRFTYGTAAGPQSATATVSGLVGSPVTVTFTAQAGTAVSIAKTVGDNGTVRAGGQANYTVQARDTHGNGKGGVTIEWGVATGGGSISPSENTTLTNGTATATRTLGAGYGTQTATATAPDLASPQTVTFSTAAAGLVEVRNNSFTPGTLTVPAGTLVIWEWQGATAAHNVTFSTAGAPTNIGNRTSGADQRTFNTTGTFAYECTNHAGMTGSVTVTP